MNHDPDTGGDRVNWLGVALRYGLAVAAVAAAALLRRWLEASFGDLRAAFITFYPTVLLVALLAGGGPGVLATLLSMAVVDWWFITPGSFFHFEEPAQGISLGIFTFTCLAVSAMAEWLRRTRWVKAFAAAKAQEADELSRQAEELSRQSEELAQQNEELQSQSEELQSLNAELGRREHLVTKLLEAARLAGAEQEALDDVCAAGLELLGPAVAALVVCEKREDQLRICAYAGALALPENWSAEGTFAGLTLCEGRTACLNDAALRPDLKFLGPVGGGAFRAALSTPLHVLGEHVGAVTAYSEEPHEWTAEQFRLIEWLAAQCGHTLDTLRLADTIRASEGKYRNLFENMTEEVHFWKVERDEQGRIVTWRMVDANPPALKTWGRASLEEIRGKTADEIFGPGAVDHYMPIVQKVMGEGTPHAYEDYFPHLDKHFRFTTVPLGEYFITTGADITDIKKAQIETATASEFLKIINRSTGTRELVKAVVTFFRQQSGCQAVGVRLKDGDDYPYYEAHGFPEEFLLLENSLCQRDVNGKVQCDSAGNPCIECMCGNVIGGRFDPSKPFFTPQGSFWTNCTTELLASTTAADRQANTRNRCNGQGYESVALIALRVGNDRLGLLQFNDTRTGRFSAGSIALWERLASYLAVAIARVRAEEALHQSESFYRQALESIPGMVFTTRPDGYCDYQSQQWVDYTGVPMSEHVGDGWNQLLHPDDRPRAYQAWQAAVEGRAPYDLEYRVRRHDGQYEWFKVRGRPIRDAEGRIVKWFGVAANVDALKQAQEALHESESRVRRKLDAVLAPEGEMGELELADVVDVPAIQSLMDGFHELTHIPMALIDRKGKVLVGVGWQEICTQFHRKHPDTCRYCLESDLELTADIAPGQFRLYKCKNNMWDMATPVLVGGKHMGYVFVGQFFLEGEQLDYETFGAQARTYGFDETKYIAALEKVPRLSRQAVDTAMGYFVKLANVLSQQSYSNVKLARTMAQREAMVEELQRSNQDLEQFAYVSSHDLQEPLRMVTSFGGIIQDRYSQFLDAKGQEYLGYVIEAGQRMQELVRGLLDYSRIGRHGKVTVPVPLAECVEEALANLRAGIEEAHARVVVDPLPALPGDRTQLTQVFQNLIGNALKFRSERPPEVHVGAERVDGRWVISVSDNGIGIDPRFAERIFMIFQRLHTRDKYAGTGIGLAICKKIVERHGGRIWVESAPGNGAMFRFTMAGS